jgi:YEATS family
LDESFPLPRIIELRVPPFRWISYGWGEFNLNIRLAFCDPGKNKPMDVVHPLKLDPGKSGREVVGYEGYFDIELDRASQFLPGEQGIEYDEVPKMAEVERAEGKGGRGNGSKFHSADDDMDVGTNLAAVRDMASFSTPDKSSKKSDSTSPDRRPILPKTGSYSDESVAERISELDDAEVRQIADSLGPYAARLHEVVKKYPFISDTAKLPYSVASSKRIFLSWNIGRQKSVEWHRARLIQTEVVGSLPPGTSTAGSDLTVKSILVWCRQNRYGPPVASEIDDDQLHYCRYCGMIEDSPPQKGQKRLKSSWGVDAYCRCGQNITDSLALMKTSSSVQEMVNRSRNIRDSPSPGPISITSREIRVLLSHVDVNTMRWVWNTMSQLNLSCLQNVDEDTQKSEDDRLAVGALLSCATQFFLNRIVRLASRQSSLLEQSDEGEAMVTSMPSGTPVHHRTTTPLVITPIHILRAIRVGREFDFLTNAGMATGSSQGVEV